jgi:hypothetical protein
VLQRRKSEYLYNLKKWLNSTTLSLSNKKEMLKFATEELKAVIDISLVKQEAQRIDTLIKNKVSKLAKKTQPQLNPN